GSPARPRRTKAITSSATTAPKMTIAPANMAHHSSLMSRAGPVAGFVTAWLELQPVARRTGSPRATKPGRLPTWSTPRVTGGAHTRAQVAVLTASGDSPRGDCPHPGAPGSDARRAGLEHAAVELVRHPQRREPVRRRVHRVAEGGERVPARA